MLLKSNVFVHTHKIHTYTYHTDPTFLMNTNEFVLNFGQNFLRKE